MTTGINQSEVLAAGIAVAASNDGHALIDSVVRGNSAMSKATGGGEAETASGGIGAPWLRSRPTPCWTRRSAATRPPPSAPTPGTRSWAARPSAPRPRPFGERDQPPRSSINNMSVAKTTGTGSASAEGAIVVVESPIDRQQDLGKQGQGDRLRRQPGRPGGGGRGRRRDPGRAQRDHRVGREPDQHHVADRQRGRGQLHRHRQPDSPRRPAARSVPPPRSATARCRQPRDRQRLWYWGAHHRAARAGNHRQPAYQQQVELRQPSRPYRPHRPGRADRAADQHRSDSGSPAVLGQPARRGRAARRPTPRCWRPRSPERAASTG